MLEGDRGRGGLTELPSPESLEAEADLGWQAHGRVVGSPPAGRSWGPQSEAGEGLPRAVGQSQGRRKQ